MKKKLQVPRLTGDRCCRCRRHANTPLTLTAANESVGKQTNKQAQKNYYYTLKDITAQPTEANIKQQKKKGLRNSPKERRKAY